MRIMPLINYCLVAAGLLSFTSQAIAQEKPRVLIIGDSISIGYTPYVVKQLDSEAVVMRPNRNNGAENCQGTTYGIKNVDRWLEMDGGNWDVIHFNFGLHDLKRVDPATKKNSNDPKHPNQADLETYEKQLRAIVEKLKKTGAKLIFATTTPVPSGVKPYRDTDGPKKYNEVAIKIMKENDIEINDLFKAAQEIISEIQKPNNVHFNEQGSKLLGDQVVRAVEHAIK
jgi:lysophospholipase L1-like esterase